MKRAHLNQMTTEHISDNFPLCLKREIEPLSETTFSTKSRPVVLNWGYMNPQKEVLYTVSKKHRSMRVKKCHDALYCTILFSR
jgi:hypothetical protein